MSPLDNFNYDDAMSETGQRSEACRRLSDKILAAFTHAYAVGEPPKNRRAGDGAVGQVDLWIKFVDARDGYKKACDKKGANASSVAAVLDDMKDAYRQWSMG